LHKDIIVFFVELLYEKQVICHLAKKW